MKMKTSLFTLIFGCFSLFGTVEKSIVPMMDQLVIRDLQGKINTDQIEEMKTFLPNFEQRLRVISFNMLFNHSESELDPINRWVHRRSRVIEYLQWANPDIIGSQELQADQLDEILCVIGDEYGSYGVGVIDGKRKGDIPAIFYRKDRLELIDGQTFYFSETPKKVSQGPFKTKNTYTVALFRDRQTDCQFVVVNTHLAFGNIERREYEAHKLRDFLSKYACFPILVTGDFNTFPFRQELDLPFYDGDKIVQMVEQGNVRDSLKLSLFGHFGPISSTNFCSEQNKSFCSEGEPGVILDHIFVNEGVQVVAHGIDPARIDGYFPSDHFPVIADVIICSHQRAQGLDR